MTILTSKLEIKDDAALSTEELVVIYIQWWSQD